MIKGLVEVYDVTRFVDTVRDEFPDLKYDCILGKKRKVLAWENKIRLYSRNIWKETWIATRDASK